MPATPNTGSLERDEVFVPKKRTGITCFFKYINNPPGRVLVLLVQLTLGWPTDKWTAWLVCYYGVPLLVVNGFLVLITYLQHTHPSLPHYDSSEWGPVRRRFTCLIGRDYVFLNKVFVISRLYVSHLFSTMPHYHAMEATKVIKPLLGEYYQCDRTPVFKAMYREVKECIYVEADEGDQKKGVFWYKNKL
ncbi:hypothetical protein Leryth_018463 [Lithospermum erythrorhizon]|nr:hypothetical protein Leryth_018463 [Lithospermum erythrorhizon]